MERGQKLVIANRCVLFGYNFMWFEVACVRLECTPAWVYVCAVYAEF